LLEASIDGAHGVLLSIAGGSDLGLFEVSAAANLIQGAAHEEANIIFGTVIDDALGDEVKVTVIAAGFEGGQPPRRQPAISRAGDLRNHQARSTPAPLESTPTNSAANNLMNHATTPADSPLPARPVAPAPLSPTPVTVPRRPVFDDELDIPDFLK
jgi:cell division protein FtsZ